MASRKKKKKDLNKSEITEEMVEMQMEAVEQGMKEEAPKPKKKAAKRVRTPRNDLSSPSKGSINFKAWFVNMMSRDRRLKEYHYEQLRIYMSGLGLTETEEVSKYENALKSYFGG